MSLAMVTRQFGACRNLLWKLVSRHAFALAGATNSHGVPGKSPRESWVLDVRATKSHTR